MPGWVTGEAAVEQDGVGLAVGAGLPNRKRVEQDGVGLAVGAGLPNRKRPLVVITEVADAAELDLVVVIIAEVAG